MYGTASRLSATSTLGTRSLALSTSSMARYRPEDNPLRNVRVIIPEFGMSERLNFWLLNGTLEGYKPARPLIASMNVRQKRERQRDF